MENLGLDLSWISDWPELVSRLLFSVGLSFDGPLLVWSIVQLATIALAFSLAFVLRQITTPIFEERLRSTAWGAARLRAAAVVLRRLLIVYSALLLWVGVIVIRTITWDSRAYFITLAASIVSALAVISISSRIIRNRTLSKLIEWGGWIFVTLTLLGILPEAMALLDAMAIEINDFRFSLLTVLQGAIVLTALIWGASVLAKLVDTQLGKLEDFSPTARALMAKIARFSLVVFAFLIGLYAIGVDFTALTLISGAVGVGLGFGLQKVVSNLVSGVILLLDKSIKPGDVITVGETFGWITSLHARYVSVTMRDGREILIPNEDLITQKVQNWSYQDSFVRLDIDFGVSYESDPHEVKKIAVDAARQHKRVLSSRPVVCHITGFGESSIDFILRFYIDDPTNGLTNVRGDIFLLLWDAFKENGIAIPYPQRDVTIKNPAFSILDPKNT